MILYLVYVVGYIFFFFSSRRRHTRCALVTGVQTCALPISGSLSPDYTLGEALAFLEAEAARIPAITAVGYRGESLSYKETGGSIGLVFGLTILLVYLLLAAQFESFVHPGVIITTVPLRWRAG